MWRCQLVPASPVALASGVGKRLPQAAGRPPARSSGGCGGIEISVEAQSGDDARHKFPDRTEEVDGGERSVADDDNAAAWQPAVDLYRDLASPVQQCLG